MNLYTSEGYLWLFKSLVKYELILRNWLTWAASKLQNVLRRWKTLKIPVIRNDAVETPTSEENHMSIFSQTVDCEQLAEYPPNAINI